MGGVMGETWDSQKTRVVRGMRALRDRCPEHNALPVWYAVVEMTISPMRTEVARYDCGCLVTVDADTMGAPIVHEVIHPHRRDSGEVMSLTWHEFKSNVDTAIREAGETGAVEIEYIDTGAFPDSVDIFVHPFRSFTRPPNGPVLPPEKWKTTLAVQG